MVSCYIEVTSSNIQGESYVLRVFYKAITTYGIAVLIFVMVNMFAELIKFILPFIWTAAQCSVWGSSEIKVKSKMCQFRLRRSKSPLTCGCRLQHKLEAAASTTLVSQWKQ